MYFPRDDNYKLLNALYRDYEKDEERMMVYRSLHEVMVIFTVHSSLSQNELINILNLIRGEAGKYNSEEEKFDMKAAHGLRKLYMVTECTYAGKLQRAIENAKEDSNTEKYLDELVVGKLALNIVHTPSDSCTVGASLEALPKEIKEIALYEYFHY